jgi:hypothetical protein
MADTQGSSAVIDSIQIKIKSDASGAADGILDVAIALGELKKNGSVGVAVRNLERLADALGKFTSVNTNASKLRSVADAAAKLSSVGSFSKVINQLNRLPTALSGLNSVNTDDIGGKFERIGNAASHLSNIKAGGLSSMVNSLSKIKDVTDSLDDDTIGRFAQKVQTLSDKLTPLSQKMSTVSSGFKAINSNAKTAGTGVRNFGSKVNATTLNLASMITVINGVVSALRPVINLLVNSISDAMEWDGISQRFGRGFGKQAEEVYTWIQRLNKELGINSQQFMQYSSTYATMLTGFGVAAEDASTMAVGYMELAYDIWAGYNDIYGSLDEAATAIRSAISGEVEPIRRAGFSIIQSTLEQTAANYGLSGSLETMTESQKSYLRYLTLVDQAYSQNLVGTYAKEMTTAEGLMRTFRQQLKSLAQTFGSVFLPILVKVMPWLNAFVELLGDAIRAVASFFGVEIQEVNWGGFTDPSISGGLGDVADSAGDVADSMGDAADSVDKVTESINDLKRATIGIDELNVISPPTKAGGAGGAGWGNTGVGGIDGLGGGILGDLGVDSLWDESIFSNIKDQVEDIKKKIKGMLPIIGGVAAAIAGWRLLKFIADIQEATEKLGKLPNVIKGLGKGLAVAGITLSVGKLVWDFTGAYLENGNTTDLLKALGTTVLGAALAAWLLGPVGAGIVLAVSGVVSLARLAIEMKEGAVDWTDPQSIVTAIVGSLESILGGALIIDALRGGKWVKAIGGAIKGGFTKAVESISLKSLATTLTTKLTGAVSSAASALGLSTGTFLGLAAAIVAAIVLALVDYDFTEIGRKLGEKVAEAILFVKDGAVAIGKAFLGWIKDAWAYVKEEFDLDSVWEFVGMMFSPAQWWAKMGPKLVEIGKKITTWFEEKFENLKGNINEFFAGFFDGLFDGLGLDMTWAEKIIDFFDIDYLDIVSRIVNPHQLGVDIVKGLWEGIKSFDIIGKVKEWCGGIVDKVKDFFGIHSPSTKFIAIGKDCVSGLVQPFTPNAIKDKVVTMWNGAKTWWNKSKGKLNEYTPSIGSIYEKVKVRWDNARTWWNSKKSAMKEYTPSIGSIFDKLYARWNNAKTWWNNKKGSLSYTPAIGDIKSRLQSAWNTAKSWWNKNVKLSIPSLSFKVTYSTPSGAIKKAIVNALDLPGWPKLSFAKNGGMFDAGSLIWAGEAGAEIVANAGGGKTGVMNVDQMQEAVYQGVYAAVVAAMRGRGEGGSQDVNVYLDGKQITAAVEKRQRERGALILGTEVYG